MLCKGYFKLNQNKSFFSLCLFLLLSSNLYGISNSNEERVFLIQSDHNPEFLLNIGGGNTYNWRGQKGVDATFWDGSLCWYGRHFNILLATKKGGRKDNEFISLDKELQSIKSRIKKLEGEDYQNLIIGSEEHFQNEVGQLNGIIQEQAQKIDEQNETIKNLEDKIDLLEGKVQYLLSSF